MNETLKDCDIVMKGGITSGVIYPGVLKELKKAYQFKSIGGTSAGAIAASLLAAAEYRRKVDQSDEGFRILEDLPTALGEEKEGESLLFRFFDPQQKTFRLFKILTSFLRTDWKESGQSESFAVRILKFFSQLARSYPFIPFVSLVATIILLAWNSQVYVALPGSFFFLFLCLVTLSGLVTALGLGIAFLFDIKVNLVENHLGLCKGSRGAKHLGENSDALSDWLEHTLDKAAGLTQNDESYFKENNTELREASMQPLLTFAHLASQGIELKMFTTCLSRGIPLTLPFVQRAIYFKPSDLKGYFSDRVIDYLIAFSRESTTATTYNNRQKLTEKYEKLYPLPEYHNLPVVVATRLSLSFPVLFSAVPLYMRKHEANLLELNPETEEPVGSNWTLERVYFTDGGICSNFPIDFFDSPLPTRPTFAIDLVPTEGKAPKDSSQHSWMPVNNKQGVLPPWKSLAEKQGFAQLIAYFVAMFETGFSWRDTFQGLAAASRNRICHIKVYKGNNEGGLNLKMSKDLINALSERGQAGGERMLQTFIEDDGWRNHRWQRFRNVIHAQSEFQDSFFEHYENTKVEPDFFDLIANPPSAKWQPKEQGDFVKEQLNAFAKQVELSKEEGKKRKLDFEKGTPKPQSDLKTVVDPTAIQIG